MFFVVKRGQKYSKSSTIIEKFFIKSVYKITTAYRDNVVLLDIYLVVQEVAHDPAYKEIEGVITRKREVKHEPFVRKMGQYILSELNRNLDLQLSQDPVDALTYYEAAESNSFEDYISP